MPTKRKPAGTPAGGQFAPDTHPEVDAQANPHEPPMDDLDDPLTGSSDRIIAFEAEQAAEAEPWSATAQAFEVVADASRRARGADHSIREAIAVTHNAIRVAETQACWERVSLAAPELGWTKALRSVREELTNELISGGANDTWAGRQNDSYRVAFDARREWLRRTQHLARER